MTSHQKPSKGNALAATFAPENIETRAHDLVSNVGSTKSRAPSGLGADLVTKFDEKRKAKYQLLRELQLHD